MLHPLKCHPRESGGPGKAMMRRPWIPAFAGMTLSGGWVRGSRGWHNLPSSSASLRSALLRANEMPKKNPLSLNALQLKTLVLLQELARLDGRPAPDSPEGHILVSGMPNPHGDHFHLGEAVVM